MWRGGEIPAAIQAPHGGILLVGVAKERSAAGLAEALVDVRVLVTGADAGALGEGFGRAAGACV